MASSPLKTASTLYPQRCKRSLVVERFSSSSSTSKTLYLAIKHLRDYCRGLSGIHCDSSECNNKLGANADRALKVQCRSKFFANLINDSKPKSGASRRLRCEIKSKNLIMQFWRD